MFRGMGGCVSKIFFFVAGSREKDFNIPQNTGILEVFIYRYSVRFLKSYMKREASWNL